MGPGMESKPFVRARPFFLPGPPGECALAQGPRLATSPAFTRAVSSPSALQEVARMDVVP
jgi:hypothetical protein